MSLSRSQNRDFPVNYPCLDRPLTFHLEQMCWIVSLHLRHSLLSSIFNHEDRPLRGDYGGLHIIEMEKLLLFSILNVFGFWFHRMMILLHKCEKNILYQISTWFFFWRCLKEKNQQTIKLIMQTRLQIAAFPLHCQLQNFIQLVARPLFWYCVFTTQGCLKSQADWQNVKIECTVFGIHSKSYCVKSDVFGINVAYKPNWI